MAPKTSTDATPDDPQAAFQAAIEATATDLEALASLALGEGDTQDALADPERDDAW